MDLNINFYNKEYPNKGDIITIIMKEPQNDIVESSIEEYPNVRGIMQFSDLTTRKRVKSIRQYLYKKPVPAEVTDIDKNTGIISLTRRYLKGIETKYTKYYLSKIKLLNIVKNILRLYSNENLNDLVKQIIHPLIDYIYENNDSDGPPEIFNIIESKYKNKDFVNLGSHHNEMINIFNEMFKEKPQKYISKFCLISVSIKNIITLFTQLEKNYSNVIFKLETSPNYYLETTGFKDKENEYHQKILNDIKTKCESLKISFKINNV